MINLLDPNNISKISTRKGFREGLYEAGKLDIDIVALCADLTDSTNMDKFRDEFPDRFFDVGVAEQNLVTVASGMAAMLMVIQQNTGVLTLTPIVLVAHTRCPSRSAYRSLQLSMSRSCAHHRHLLHHRVLLLRRLQRFKLPLVAKDLGQMQ